MTQLEMKFEWSRIVGLICDLRSLVDAKTRQRIAHGWISSHFPQNLTVRTDNRVRNIDTRVNMIMQRVFDNNRNIIS